MATTPKNTIDLTKADKELDAEKAWQQDGSDPDTRPATPNLDAIRATYEAPKRGRSGGGAARNPITVRFTRNGRAVPESQNVLSRMAFYFSASINDGERLDVTQLRDLLKSKGVDDPEHTAWDVEMCKGVRWGAVLLTDEAALKKAVDAPRMKAGTTTRTTTPTKAAPVKKAPAKKAAPAKSAAATKAERGKEQVTPRPKAASTKAKPKSKLDDTTPETPAPHPVAKADGTLAERAAAERKAVSAWRKGGEKGDKPATPAIDELAAKNAAA